MRSRRKTLPSSEYASPTLSNNSSSTSDLEIYVGSAITQVGETEPTGWRSGAESHKDFQKLERVMELGLSHKQDSRV